MTEGRHNIPLNDMMPKPGPGDKESLYKGPPPEIIRNTVKEDVR